MSEPITRRDLMSAMQLTRNALLGQSMVNVAILSGDEEQIRTTSILAAQAGDKLSAFIRDLVGVDLLGSAESLTDGE